MAKTASSALQSLLDIVCLWSTINCLHFNLVKCSSVIIAPSKQNAAAASIALSPAYKVNSSAISTVVSIKILGVIFTSEQGRHEQEQAVPYKVARKLSILQRNGSMLNTRFGVVFYKTCI